MKKSQRNFQGLLNNFYRNALGQMNQPKLERRSTIFPKIYPKFKKIYAIDSYEYRINNSKKHTNFQELLIEYKKNNLFSDQERNKVITELEKVYDFLSERKKILDDEIKDQNHKLFFYIFKKVKDIIQIYKIFEIMTKIILYFIEYDKILSPNEYQKEVYILKMRNAKEIIKFKKKKENSLIKRNPDLDDVKLFDNYNEEKHKKTSTSNFILEKENIIQLLKQ